MFDARDITTFNDAEPPPGESPYLPGHAPTADVSLVAYDPSWPAAYAQLAAKIIAALGPRALALEHVGSTAVPGLDAKPTIDIDLTVADTADEGAYVPALEQHGFTHVIRESWWYGHRLLRHAQPRANLHVWSPGCPESARHLILRDWLRAHPDDRELYLQAKRAAAEHTRTAGSDVTAYNAHKQRVIREICARAFAARGLIGR